MSRIGVFTPVSMSPLRCKPILREIYVVYIYIYMHELSIYIPIIHFSGLKCELWGLK